MSRATTVGCGIQHGCVLSHLMLPLCRPLTKIQTAEHLTLASLGKSKLEPRDAGEAGDRSNSQFSEDQSIPAMFRAKLQDYFRSGYDRGHM